MEFTLRGLQKEQEPWVDHNFEPGNTRNPARAYKPLLGVVEEVGELSHAHLKSLQGIRTGEDHAAKSKDAIGDLVIFLADYCTAMGYDFQECVEATWNQVKTRDWKKDPVKGVTAS